MINYFKVFERLPGDGRAYVGQQVFEFFDSDDVLGARAAYDRAMAESVGLNPLSVYARTVGVPMHVPIIGDMPERAARKASVSASEPVVSAVGGE